VEAPKRARASNEPLGKIVCVRALQSVRAARRERRGPAEGGPRRTEERAPPMFSGVLFVICTPVLLDGGTKLQKTSNAENVCILWPTLAENRQPKPRDHASILRAALERAGCTAQGERCWNFVRFFFVIVEQKSTGDRAASGPMHAGI
jgi:hypothetical protein